MSDLHKQVNQHPRQRCYFCSSEGPIETHHIVPRRYNGSDKDVNLVDLCPTCHERLEALYDDRFYEALGVEKPEVEGQENDILQAGWDDKDTSRVQRKCSQAVKNVIEELNTSEREGVPKKELYDKAIEKYDILNEEFIEDTMLKLRRKGEVYEPKQNRFRTT